MEQDQWAEDAAWAVDRAAADSGMGHKGRARQEWVHAADAGDDSWRQRPDSDFAPW